jgi:DNA-binding NarL/FixJ family response regulator
MNREAYEELYRAAWLKQNKIDREVNKKLQAPEVNYQQARENGLKGGRPSQRADVQAPRDITIKLSPKAKVVNRMLNKGMKLREVGEILGISHQAVSHIKQQYGLPRKDVK